LQLLQMLVNTAVIFLRCNGTYYIHSPCRHQYQKMVQRWSFRVLFESYYDR
jgi:hypothetical protein